MIDLSNGQTQEIQSPFYPNTYPNKRQCKWVFHADEFQRITIRFSDLAVEYHESCDFDRVTVQTGESVRTFCGNEKPFAMTSFGNRMVVEFRTDGDGDFKGFKASVVAADQGFTFIYVLLTLTIQVHSDCFMLLWWMKQNFQISHRDSY